MTRVVQNGMKSNKSKRVLRAWVNSIILCEYEHLMCTFAHPNAAERSRGIRFSTCQIRIAWILIYQTSANRHYDHYWQCFKWLKAYNGPIVAYFHVHAFFHYLYHKNTILWQVLSLRAIKFTIVVFLHTFCITLPFLLLYKINSLVRYTIESRIFPVVNNLINNYTSFWGSLSNY